MPGTHDRSVACGPACPSITVTKCSERGARRGNGHICSLEDKHPGFRAVLPGVGVVASQLPADRC